MAEISVRGLSKVYPNGVVAVRDVHLEVADGEFLVLVGPSGCGKSTLLRMIAGLEEVTAGELLIGGSDITDAQPRERDIAMVFQSYALYPHMTVRKNIGYPLKLAGIPSQEIDARVDEAARTLQLEAVLDRKPGQLSGGQRQRVAMGRAIVRKPSAFLMDEPLSNLDAKLRVQMRAEICRLQREFHTTTIYVTHDQVEAMTMGDRVAVLNAGQIEQCDRPRDLYDRPANLFVAAFIGSPSMNFFTATVEAPRHGTRRRRGDVVIPLDPSTLIDDIGSWVGRTITVGVRAESITATPQHEAAPQLSGTVEFVEELGSEVIVHTRVAGLGSSLEIDAAQIAARRRPRDRAHPQQHRHAAAGAFRVPAGRHRHPLHRPRERPLLRSGRALAAQRSPPVSADLPTLGIGVDIGGTSTKAAVIDGLGALVRCGPEWRHRRRARRDAVSSHRDAGRRCCGRPSVSVSDVNAIGIGIPGTVDPQRGTVRFAVNVGIGHDDIDLGSRLTAELGVDVHVENDVRAAALGADWYLATQQVRSTTSPTSASARASPPATSSAVSCAAATHWWPARSGTSRSTRRARCAPAGRSAASRRSRRVRRSSGCGRPRPGASAAALHRAASGGDTAARRLWDGVIGGLKSRRAAAGADVGSRGDRAQRRCRLARRCARDAIAERLATDAQQSEFLGSLDLGARMRVIDPTVPLGPIGAVRAAHAGAPRTRRRPAARRGGRGRRVSRLLLAGGSVVRLDRIEPADVLIDDGVVAAVGPRLGARRRADARRLGPPGAPGFVDLQINGAVGVDLADEPERTRGGRGRARPLRRHRLPADGDHLAGGHARAGDGRAGRSTRRLRGGRPLGLHLEGPFLNPDRRGAHDPALLRPPSPELVEGWTRADGVALVTLAPELPGGLAVVEQLVDAGVVVSAGHTAATADELDGAVLAGLSGVTHLFNAMGPFGHRDPGPIGLALADGR